MAINLYNTKTMLSLQEAVKPKSTFLRDRYFPTASEDIFTTEEVLVDFKDETDATLAPVVIPGKGGVPLARGGYQTHQFTPPLVAPERTLTADQLLRRQAGESVFSSVTPEQREAKFLAQDMADLNEAIDLREEYMAAQVLLNNGYTLHQYADKYGSAETIDMEIKFYTGGSNPSTYTPATKWDNGGDIIADIGAMANALTKRGLKATDLIVSGKVADVMLSNSTILSLLDNRRFILAQEVNPQENADGSVLIAVLNVKGHLINVFSYTRQYRSETKSGSPAVYTMVDFIPEKYCVMTAPGMGRTAYGAITQIEGASRDFVTYAAKRVPHSVIDENANTRTQIQQSRPLVMPKVLNSAISSQVLT